MHLWYVLTVPFVLFTPISFLLTTSYNGSPSMVVFGRYVSGLKQPPGPQNETEYRFPRTGAICKPKAKLQSVFQNPVYPDSFAALTSEAWDVASTANSKNPVDRDLADIRPGDFVLDIDFPGEALVE